MQMLHQTLNADAANMASGQTILECVFALSILLENHLEQEANHIQLVWQGKMQGHGQCVMNIGCAYIWIEGREEFM